VSRGDARRFVSFGSQCLLSTPISGVTPYALLTAWPGLLSCISMARTWAEESDGDEIKCIDLLGAQDLAHQIALKAAGDFHPEVTGPPAACWSVYHLTHAAMTAAGMHDGGSALQDARKSIVLTARLSRRAGVEVSTTALEHQLSLFRSIFHRSLL
jgi:hypothetical protein